MSGLRGWDGKGRGGEVEGGVGFGRGRDGIKIYMCVFVLV